jgi:hypothetical protein
MSRKCENCGKRPAVDKFAGKHMCRACMCADAPGTRGVSLLVSSAGMIPTNDKYMDMQPLKAALKRTMEKHNIKTRSVQEVW